MSVQPFPFTPDHQKMIDAVEDGTFDGGIVMPKDAPDDTARGDDDAAWIKHIGANHGQ